MGHFSAQKADACPGAGIYRNMTTGMRPTPPPSGAALPNY
jgi:hypothetical protein